MGKRMRAEYARGFADGRPEGFDAGHDVGYAIGYDLGYAAALEFESRDEARAAFEEPGARPSGSLFRDTKGADAPTKPAPDLERGPDTATEEVGR